MAAGNSSGRSGTVDKAIALAGPPKAKAPESPKPHEYPAHVPENPPWKESPERRVGLIRWIWRWIW